MSKARRERELILMVAAKGYGKSTALRALIDALPDKNALIFKEGVNLFDPAFKGIPIVSIWNYKGGKAIIDGSEIEYKEFVTMCKESFRNGTLVIDDASLYESDNLTQPMKKLVIDLRKLGIDVVLVYHGMSDTPIKQFPYVNRIILGHTTDNFDYKVKKLPEKDRLLRARDRIKRQVDAGNKYYKEIIKLS